MLRGHAARLPELAWLGIHARPLWLVEIACSRAAVGEHIWWVRGEHAEQVAVALIAACGAATFGCGCAAVAAAVLLWLRLILLPAAGKADPELRSLSAANK